jgi:hypothetical protein
VAAYLPALYAAYSRRETEVVLLNARAGVPSWGPELLVRTHLLLGPGALTVGTLPDLYAQWERWAIDVGDSHSAYLPLVRFRSSQSATSWVISLLAVLDSAALFLALSPQSAPVATPPRHGRISLAGELTTSRPPTRWPSLSTPCQCRGPDPAVTTRP